MCTDYDFLQKCTYPVNFHKMIFELFSQGEKSPQQKLCYTLNLTIDKHKKKLSYGNVRKFLLFSVIF